MALDNDDEAEATDEASGNYATPITNPDIFPTGVSGGAVDYFSMPSFTGLTSSHSRSPSYRTSLFTPMTTSLPIPLQALAPDTPAMTRVLANLRREYFNSELQNPQVRDLIHGAFRHESGNMQAVLESIMNRVMILNMKNHLKPGDPGCKTLESALFNGFYGPVNRGCLDPNKQEGGLSDTLRSLTPDKKADFDAAVIKVMNGSNIIGYRDDQGMINEIHSRRTEVSGEYYGDMNSENTAVFVEQLNKMAGEYAAAETTSKTASAVESTASTDKKPIQNLKAENTNIPGVKPTPSPAKLTPDNSNNKPQAAAAPSV